MTTFNTTAELRAACLELPPGDAAAAEEAARRNGILTKPPGAL
jgi:nicotinate-nucleotide--dimethylbenzimidazole phosphoribosyltransferase